MGGVGNQREREADRREAEADRRDRAADQRDQTADQRDQTADRRDRAADRRERCLADRQRAELWQGRPAQCPGCGADGVEVLLAAESGDDCPVCGLAAEVLRRFFPPPPEVSPTDDQGGSLR